MLDTEHHEKQVTGFTLAFYMRGGTVREFYRIEDAPPWPAGGWLEVPLGWLCMRDAGYLPWPPGARTAAPTLEELAASFAAVYPDAQVTFPAPEHRARSLGRTVLEMAAQFPETAISLARVLPRGVAPQLVQVPIYVRLLNPRLAAKAAARGYRVVALPNSSQVALLTQDWREVPIPKQYRPLRATVRSEPALAFTGTGWALLMAEIATVVARGGRLLRCRVERPHPFLWLGRSHRLRCEEHERQLNNAYRLFRHYVRTGNTGQQRKLRRLLRTLGYRAHGEVRHREIAHHRHGSPPGP